jgi:hypothetical protein
MLPARMVNLDVPIDVTPAQAGVHTRSSLLLLARLTRPVRGACKNLTRCFIEQIDPLGIHAFDQANLPRALPFLDLLLAPDCFGHRVVQLVVDERVHLVAIGEAGDQVLLVLVDPIGKIAGDTCIEGAVALAREHIDTGVLHRPIPLHRLERGMLAHPHPCYTVNWAPASAGVTLY